MHQYTFLLPKNCSFIKSFRIKYGGSWNHIEKERKRWSPKWHISWCRNDHMKNVLFWYLNVLFFSKIWLLSESVSTGKHWAHGCSRIIFNYNVYKYMKKICKKKYLSRLAFYIFVDRICRKNDNTFYCNQQWPILVTS